MRTYRKRAFRSDEERSEDDQLPALPGIDVESSLIRVGGNRKLYKKLLIKFRDDYSNSFHEIKGAIENNNLEDAERYAHTVKGVAGNIGVSVSCIKLPVTLKLGSESGKLTGTIVC